MTCASRLIECPHCAAKGCRNEKCRNLVLAAGKCTKCGERVKKAKPLHRVCKQVSEVKEEAPAPVLPPTTPRTAAAIAASHAFELPPPRPIMRPVRHQTEPPAAIPAVPATPARSRLSASLATGGLVFLLLAFAGFASYGRFTPPIRPPASPDGANIFVDAGVLASRYQLDRADADHLFKGRMVTVSGRLERVGDDSVSLRDSAGLVRCTLRRRASAAERALLAGTPVTLRGLVAGSPAQQHIELNACELMAELD